MRLDSLVLCLAATACGAPADGPEDVELLGYDDSIGNMKAEGEIGGTPIRFVVDENTSVTADFDGEREYATVAATPGQPDYSRAVICKVGPKAATADGELGLALEGAGLPDLPPGTYELGELELAVEYQPRGPGIEEYASGGTIEIKVNTFDSAHPENAIVYEGGVFGGVFDLEFDGGGTLRGSFFVEYGTTAVEIMPGGECE